MAKDETTTEDKAVDAEAQTAPSDNKGVDNPTPVEPKEETVVGGSRDGKNQGDAHPEIAKEKAQVSEAPEDKVAVAGSETTPHVVQHLDRDPNDPRNLEPTPSLPSLNDPGQS